MEKYLKVNLPNDCKTRNCFNFSNNTLKLPKSLFRTDQQLDSFKNGNTLQIPLSNSNGVSIRNLKLLTNMQRHEIIEKKLKYSPSSPHETPEGKSIQETPVMKKMPILTNKRINHRNGVNGVQSLK